MMTDLYVDDPGEWLPGVGPALDGDPERGFGFVDGDQRGLRLRAGGGRNGIARKGHFSRALKRNSKKSNKLLHSWHTFDIHLCHPFITKSKGYLHFERLKKFLDSIRFQLYW